MLEPVLAYYLNLYLGKYVTGLDADKLRLSVWAGDVVLKGLKLRSEALKDLNLPITVKGGVIGTLRLKSTEEEEERLAVRKREELEAEEKQWVQGMQDAEHALGAAANPGYIQGIINVVLGNLKLKVTNLHIRYEDGITQAGHPFAVGLTLHSIGAFTVDENNNEVFVKKAAMKLLRKAAQLSRLALYFNTDVESLWSETNEINKWTLDEWDKFFEPGIASDEGVESPRYLLKPVDGDAKYSRSADELVTRREDPHQDLHMVWPEFALRLTHLQTVNVTLLLQELSRHQLRRPHQALRPTTRPMRGSAQLWWRYAMKAVCSQRRHGRHHWVDVARYLKIQREYVPLYVSHLCSKEGSKDVTQLSRIAEMDKELPKDVALHFRKLAHAQDNRLKEKERSKASAEKPPPRTWVSWLGFGAAPASGTATGEPKVPDPKTADEDATVGGSQNDETEAESTIDMSEGQEGSVATESDIFNPSDLKITPRAAPTPGHKEDRGFLTHAEVQALEEMVQEQASVIESSDPLQLLTRAVLVVSNTSMCLEDASGDVAILSAHNMQLSADLFQVTKKVVVSVGSSALVSEDSNIIRTGALSDQEDQFLSVEYTSSPPHESPEDVQIDHDVRVRMAPSYVTYDLATVHRIQEFFRIDHEGGLDLSALGAQASARIQEMQAIARQQMHAAWSSRPKIQIYLDLHAPKVAMPISPAEGSSPATTLIIDLGSLVIASNPLEAASLSPEEAAIYDCYGLVSYDVAVHLVRGRFAWPDMKAMGSGHVNSTQMNSGSLFDKHAQHSRASMDSKGSCRLDFKLDDYLSEGALAVPLLGHCSTTASVHVAHASHPTLPLMRIGLQVPEITLHVSPYRLTQLLLVTRLLVPVNTAAVDPAPWVKAAEYTSNVETLTWQGLVGTNSEWQERFAVVYRGTLYFMQSEGSPFIMRQVALWQGRRVLPLTAADTGGVSNVLAVLPSHVSKDRALEEPSAVIMKLQSPYMQEEWLRRLRQSAAQMQSVALWHTRPDDASTLQLDSTLVATSSVNNSGSAPMSPRGQPTDSPTLQSQKAESIPETAAATHQSAGTGSTFMRAVAYLGRLSVHVSARAADEFWPPPSISTPHGAHAHGPSQVSAVEASQHLEGMVDQERLLISIIAEGGLLKYQQALGYMEVVLRLQRFEIKDRLTGSKNSELEFLARSFSDHDEDRQNSVNLDRSSLGPLSPGFNLSLAHLRSPMTPTRQANTPHRRASHGATVSNCTPLSSSRLAKHSPAVTPRMSGELTEHAVTVTEQIEEEDSDDMLSARSDSFEASQPGSSQSISDFQGTPAAAEAIGPEIPSVLPLNTLEEAVENATNSLALISFCMWDAATSQTYQNVDMSLDISVSALYFLCNRPTVAALMCFGHDIIFPEPPPAPASNPGAAAAASSTAAAQDTPNPVSPSPTASHAEAVAAEMSSGDATGRSTRARVSHDAPVALSGGNQRTVFKLGLVVSKLELQLGYEGYSVTPLLQCNVTDFDMNVDVHPETLLLTAELGNAQVEDLALPIENPYRRICGLRNDEATSLISIQFRMHSLQESFSEPRVPDGTQYYSLQATMQAVTIVYLNRFLDEFLRYLSGLFYLCPPVPDQVKKQREQTREDIQSAARAEPGDSSSPVRRQVSESVPAYSKDAQASVDAAEIAAIIVLLDVEMNAPVIEIPRQSTSADSLEVDLGVLTLTNSIVLLETGQTVDVIDVTLQQVSARVLKGRHEGRNLIRELDQGLSLRITRAIIDPYMNLPGIDCHIDVPCVLACVSDEEYNFCCTVSLANLREAIRLPPSAVWLEQMALEARQAARGGLASVDETSPDVEGLPPSKSNEQPVNNQIRATLNFGRVELECTNEHKGREPTQLALLHASNLFISYVSLAPRHMDVRISLPRLEAHDLRESRAAESSLVLSSSTHVSGEGNLDVSGPSLLTLAYTWSAAAGQDVVLRLQRPTVVAEVDFMLAALKFVVPSMVLGSEPTPFTERDTHLTTPVTTAADHLWLSPSNRLLADSPNCNEYIYDGAGYSLMLPAELDISNELPLIVMGTGVTLRLKNVSIFNAQSLSSCLSMKPGAKLLVQVSDGVQLFNHAPMHLRDPMAALELVTEQRAAALEEQRNCTAPAQSAHLQVDITAVGMGFHVVAAATDSVKKVQDVPLLAVYTDVQVTYGYGISKKETASICLKGMRMESQVVQRDQNATDEIVSQLHGGIHRRGAGITQGKVLEPIDLTAAYKKEDGKQDWGVDISKIVLNVSPDVLTILSNMSTSVLRPIQAASPDSPLHAVSKYKRICSSHHKKCTTPPFNSIGSGGLDFLGQEKGFTFWAPEAPAGHGILGHLVTSGTSQPIQEVMSIALNSGVVAWPLKYQECWKADTATIWQAVPPPGYVALGSFVTLGEKPVMHSMLCVHERVLVMAPVGECVVRASEGSLWAVDNAAGSFFFSECTDGLPSTACYDLRSPLGVTATPTDDSASMHDGGAAEDSAYNSERAHSDFRQFRSFEHSWKDLQKHAQVTRSVTTTLVFDRIWSNKSKNPARHNVASIWRPVPPSGYKAVGDCLVVGTWAAPTSVTVLREDLQEQQPLVAPAQDFHLVWKDEMDGLTIYRPVPPPGYTSVGMIATDNEKKPPALAAYCVRNDMITDTHNSPLFSLDDLFPVQQGVAVSLCTYDRATRALQLRPRGTAKATCPVLNLPSSPAVTQAAAAQPIKVHMRSASICVRVRNILRVPLLEVETSEVGADYDLQANGSISASANCSPEVWSYNEHLKEWEEVIQKVGVQARYKHNLVSRPDADVGTFFTISVDNALHVTLTHAALDSTCRALAWWRNVAAGDDSSVLYRHAAAADNAVVLTRVHNAVGERLEMWMDFGDRSIVGHLQEGVKDLLQPLVRPVPRPRLLSGVEESHKPSMVLCVTLEHLVLKDAHPDATTQEYFFTVGLRAGEDAKQVTMQPVECSQAAICTRCLRVTGADSKVSVMETFLLDVPPMVAAALAEDTNSELRRRRVRSNKLRNLQLRMPLTLAVRMHDQKTMIPMHDRRPQSSDDQDKGKRSSDLLAAGSCMMQPDWLRSAALKSVQGGSATGDSGPHEETSSVTVNLHRVQLPDRQEPASKARDASMSIRLQLQRVSHWVDDSPDAEELSLSRSQRGNRSLRIPNKDLRWQPVVQDGMQRATGAAALSGSMVGLDILSGVVLEESFTAGVRRETIRSTVRVANSLDFPVQIAIKLSPSSAIFQKLRNALPGTASPSYSGAEQLQLRSSEGRGVMHPASNVPAMPEVAEDEVLENERFVPLRGFRSSNLMGLDPKRYSKLRNGSNSSNHFPIVNPPPGWLWQGPWRLEKGPNTDAEGWSYAVDFSMLSYPFRSGTAKRTMAHFVRRRRWVRQRCRDPAAYSTPRTARQRPTSPTASAIGTSAARDDHMLMLGMLPVGHEMMIPLSLVDVSAELRLRPCLSVEDPENPTFLHSWSHGASNGSHSLILNIDSLEGTTTRLLQCKKGNTDAAVPRHDMVAETQPLDVPEHAPRCSMKDLSNNDCFLSMNVDATRLENAGPSQSDWKVTLSPPLRVENLLPVPADYIIFELPASSNPANTERQSGQVQAGGLIASYAADVRTQVSIKFVPLGYQWASPTAAMLSAGYSSPSAGVGGPQMLPAHMSLANANTKMALRVHIERELDMVMEEDVQELDPGAEIAMGCPMLVRLFVPFWVLNLTQVLISTALVERARRSSSPDLVRAGSSSGGSSERRLIKEKPQEAHIAAPLRLDTIECSTAHGAHSPPNPCSHCQVLPGTCELLSYTPSSSHKGQGVEVAVHINVIGAPWSPGLVLMMAADQEGIRMHDSPLDSASESLRDGRPVLLRAHVPENGMVLDIVAHLQVAPAPFQRCKVLQLMPHISITNHTGVHMNLSLANSPVHAPTARAGKIMLTSKAHGEMLPASPMPQASDSSPQKPLPAGVVGVPLNFRKNQARSFTLSVSSADSAAWSQPITVNYPGLPELFVKLPVPETPENLDSVSVQAPSDGAPRTGTSSGVSLLQAGSSKSFIVDRKERGNSGDDTGRRDEKSAVLRASMQVSRPGCLHIVLHSIGCEAPYLLQNRTREEFVYRQYGTADKWRILSGYSAVGFAWPFMDGEKRLEVGRADKRSVTLKVALEPDQSSALNSEVGGNQLTVRHHGKATEYVMHLRTVVDGILHASGISDISGPSSGFARLGTTGLDSTLIISEVDTAEKELSDRRQSGRMRLQQPIPTQSRLIVANVDVSIVDHTPEELVLLHARNVDGSFERHLGPNARFSRVSLAISHMQIDDQIWGSPFPVAACVLPAADAHTPALEFTMLVETTMNAGKQRMPYFTVDMPRRLQIAVSEALAWRLVALMQALPLDVLAMSTASAAAEDTSTSGIVVPKVDPTLSIGMLTISSVDGVLHARHAPHSRPREAQLYVSAAALNMLPEHLDNVRIKLDAKEVIGVSIRASKLWSILQEQLRSELMNIGFSIFYSYLGYFGTSAAGHSLSVVSSALKTWTGNSQAASKPSAPVSGFTDGVVKGGGSVVSGFVKGISGVVSKPIAGVREDGATGFFKGMGQGVMGLAVMPIAGAIDLGAHTMQGVNASLTTAFQGSTMEVAHRRRIQRAVSSTGAVVPFDLERSLAHALLKLTVMSPEGTKRRVWPLVNTSKKRQRLSLTAGEGQLGTVCILPNGQVVMLTSRGIMLLQAPEYVAMLQQMQRAGGVISLDGIGPGEVVWALKWANVLAPELRGQQHREADHVVLHERVPAPPYDIKCESPAQARELLHRVQHHLMGLLQVRMLDADLAGSSIEDAEIPPAEGQSLPFRMPSMEWRLVTTTPRSERTDDVASIWRPVGAPRYCSLGDVLRKGTEPPSHPIMMYVNVRHSRDSGGACFAHPVHYLLVWREFSQGGMTIWRAQAPDGYQALGCVASRGLHPPPRSAMVCVRKDLLQRSRCWNSPTWQCSSSDEMAWRISCWQVDAESGIFCAVRSHADKYMLPVYDRCMQDVDVDRGMHESQKT